MTVGYHSHENPHTEAARMLAQRMTYKAAWYMVGSTDDGRGFLFASLPVSIPCFDTRTGA